MAAGTAWDQFAALLPDRAGLCAGAPAGLPPATDRGPGRRRKADPVLRFGARMRRSPTAPASATTIRERRNEWIRAGIFAKLKHDRPVSAMTASSGGPGGGALLTAASPRRPAAGACAGRSPVDRGQLGMKRSLHLGGQRPPAAPGAWPRRAGMAPRGRTPCRRTRNPAARLACPITGLHRPELARRRAPPTRTATPARFSGGEGTAGPARHRDPRHRRAAARRPRPAPRHVALARRLGLDELWRHTSRDSTSSMPSSSSRASCLPPQVRSPEQADRWARPSWPRTPSSCSPWPRLRLARASTRSRPAAIPGRVRRGFALRRDRRLATRARSPGSQGPHPLPSPRSSRHAAHGKTSSEQGKG